MILIIIEKLTIRKLHNKLNQCHNYCINIQNKNHYINKIKLSKSTNNSIKNFSKPPVYVGILSFNISQQNIYQLFSRCGYIQRIIMGINDQGTFHDFCFVQFQTHQQAAIAVQYITKTKLCGRIIIFDWDPGFKQGSQKGRGYGGYQKRDHMRNFQDFQGQIPRPQKKQKMQGQQLKKRNIDY